MRIVIACRLCENLTFMVGMDSWEDYPALKGFEQSVAASVEVVVMFEVEGQELLAQAVD